MRKTFRTLTLSLIAFSVLAIPAAADCPSGTFNCYCNGNWVGCVTSVTYCWNACGNETLFGPVVDASKNRCEEGDEGDGQLAIFCFSEPISPEG